MSKRFAKAITIILLLILLPVTIAFGYFVINSIGETPDPTVTALSASNTPDITTSFGTTTPINIDETREPPAPTQTLNFETSVPTETLGITATASQELNASPSPTLEPTSTATTPPDPDVCSRVSIQYQRSTSNIALWQLNNMNFQPAEITRISLSWPDQNEAIFNAFLDGVVIWSGGDLVSPTIISEWIGDSSDREVLGRTRLEFLFGTDAASSGYEITVELSNGCSTTATN